MGAACGLWIPAGSLTQAQRVVEQMIRKIGTPDDNRQDGCFSCEDTQAIGGSKYEFAMPFYCSWEAFDYNVEDEASQIEESFGFRPEPGCFGIGSSVKGRDDDRALAEIAAHLAEQLGGVVDFGVTLAEATELPGRTASLHYRAVSGPATRTLLNAEAMRAWSRDPHCWMVK